MSDLYTRPDDLRSDLREGTRTGNWFQDTFTDAVTPGVTLNRDGSVDRQGLAWWAQLITPGAEKIAEQRKAISDAEIIDAVVTRSELTDEQIKAASKGKPLTTANVRNVVSEGRRSVGERITPLQQENIDLNRNTARNTEKRLDYQIQLAEMKDARDRAERLDNKAEERRDRLDLLDRQDHRYSQEMQRYDKRRQTETIQSLIGGLASLGAAFAI